MKFKFLGTAAALLGAVSTAQAADLGKKAPAAVDYVKVCDAYGAGFFYIPGGDTCLKIHGWVRARAFVGNDNGKGTGQNTAGVYTAGEFIPSTGKRLLVNNDNSRLENNFSTDFGSSIRFDARTNTELGLLRSFVDVRVNTGANVDKAFVQLGGLTAGFATSAYSFGGSVSYGLNFGHLVGDNTVNLLSYTLQAGNGISATISLEDGGADYDLAKKDGIFFDTYGAGTVSSVYSGAYGGAKVPDFVANVKLTQSWGSAQLSAAAHQNYASTSTGGDKWGFAVLGGVQVNLPMIAAGDYVKFQAAYADGATKYVGGLASDFAIQTTTDALGAVTTKVDQTQAWSVNGGFFHKFSPSLSAGIDAAYGSYDQVGANDYKVTRLIGSVEWAPVAGFDLTVGLEYQNWAFTDATKAAYAASANSDVARTIVTKSLGDANALLGFAQIRRSF